MAEVTVPAAAVSAAGLKKPINRFIVDWDKISEPVFGVAALKTKLKVYVFEL